MSYSLVFTEHYEKMERRFLKTHPNLSERYHKTLTLLEQEPFILPCDCIRCGAGWRDCTPYPSTCSIASPSSLKCASRRSSWSASAATGRCIDTWEIVLR